MMLRRPTFAIPMADETDHASISAQALDCNGRRASWSRCLGGAADIGSRSVVRLSASPEL